MISPVVDALVTDRMLRLFAISWALLLLLAGWALWCLMPGTPLALLPWALAFFCATGVLVPAWMRRPYRLVERLLAPVGRVVALVALAVAFFMVFTPFACLLRLLRWDPLRLDPGRRPVSGWRELSGNSVPPDYRWQY